MVGTPSEAAYRLNGRFRIDGATVQVKAFLFRGLEEIAAWEQGGTLGKLPMLAESLVQQAGTEIEKHASRKP